MMHMSIGAGTRGGSSAAGAQRGSSGHASSGLTVTPISNVTYYSGGNVVDVEALSYFRSLHDKINTALEAFRASVEFDVEGYKTLKDHLQELKNSHVKCDINDVVRRASEAAVVIAEQKLEDFGLVKIQRAYPFLTPAEQRDLFTEQCSKIAEQSVLEEAKKNDASHRGLGGAVKYTWDWLWSSKAVNALTQMPVSEEVIRQADMKIARIQKAHVERVYEHQQAQATLTPAPSTFLSQVPLPPRGAFENDDAYALRMREESRQFEHLEKLTAKNITELIGEGMAQDAMIPPIMGKVVKSSILLNKFMKSTDDFFEGVKKSESPAESARHGLTMIKEFIHHGAGRIPLIKSAKDLGLLLSSTSEVADAYARDCALRIEALRLDSAENSGLIWETQVSQKKAILLAKFVGLVGRYMFTAPAELAQDAVVFITTDGGYGALIQRWVENPQNAAHIEKLRAVIDDCKVAVSSLGSQAIGLLEKRGEGVGKAAHGLGEAIYRAESLEDKYDGIPSLPLKPKVPAKSAAVTQHLTLENAILVLDTADKLLTVGVFIKQCMQPSILEVPPPSMISHEQASAINSSYHQTAHLLFDTGARPALAKADIMTEEDELLRVWG